MDTMNAVRLHAYGGPEVLVWERAPCPEPADDDILIRVFAAGVNPADWKIRSGRAYALPLPLTLGWDVSGIVAKAGRAVRGFQIGDEVWGMLPFPEGGGAYAEYVTSPVSALAHKPRTLSHLEAAAVPLAGLTAWQALFGAACLCEGMRVLIHAAAGGVGHLAVQLARWKGAHVIGTASRRNEDFLRSLGVDEVIDYRATRFDRVALGIDVVLDTLGGETWGRTRRTLREDGTLVSLLVKPPARDSPNYDARARYILAQADGSQLSVLADLVDAGDLAPVIDTVFPLRRAREAHELSERGHAQGKIVLQVSE